MAIINPAPGFINQSAPPSLQAQAILLPFVGFTATSTFSVDQTNSEQQSRAILLANNGRPATFNYNVDSGVPTLQSSSVVLLSMGSPSTFNYSVDQTLNGTQNRAILLPLQSPSTSSYNVDQTIPQIQNRAILLAIQPTYGVLALTEKKESLAVTAYTAGQFSLAILEHKEVISITAYTAGQFSLALTEGKETLSVSASVINSGTIALTEKKEAISTSAFTSDIFSIALNENKHSLSLSSAIIPSGGGTLPGLQSQAMLLSLSSSATSSYNVDQSVLALQNRGVLLPLQYPATASANADQSLIGQQNKAILLSLVACSTSSYSVDQAVAQLQNRAQLLSFVPSASTTRNADQSLIGLQNKAILLTNVLPSTASVNAESTPQFQNKAMLLSLSAPASSSANADQSVIGQQNKASAILAVLPDKASLSVAEHKQSLSINVATASIGSSSIPGIQSAAILLSTLPTSTRIAPTDQMVAGIQNKAILLTTMHSIIAGSIFLTEKKESLSMPNLMPWGSASGSINLQNKAILLGKVSPASSHSNADSAVSQKAAAALLVVPTLHYVKVGLSDTEEILSRILETKIINAKIVSAYKSIESNIESSMDKIKAIVTQTIPKIVIVLQDKSSYVD